ncbi:hypothetical protein L218DRAFT_961759 [Marasmius fiardii PR-910]|nr:hypothetical protein L218DRAFT_961759 [Marasmius fiardii PR-910]
MFGEEDSESPRVPSPWDSLISTPPSSSPHTCPVVTSSPLALSTIPKLVPEADDGNVEYKLQLLSPSPARFARLVTQLKWRLLEGGGQAYYELGVADSGALVGLSRVDLERSLETLEMMAGEIGASVIVVKEIEVPAAMAEYAAAQEDYRQGRRERKGGIDDDTTTATETENELSTTDVDTDDARNNDSKAFEHDFLSVFIMDPEPDHIDKEGVEQEASTPQFSIDLEISSVFKPRPVRARMTHVQSTLHADSKRGHRGQKTKKVKHPGSGQLDGTNDKGDAHGEQNPSGKSHSRRAARDRRREEKRRALLAVASNSFAGTSAEPRLKQEASSADTLVSGLKGLHVRHEEEPAVVMSSPTIATDELIPVINLTAVVDPIDKSPLDSEDDDVFTAPTPSMPFKTFQSATESITPLTERTEGLLSAASITGKDDMTKGTHLIVEALVVRKMSLEEAFLDFGGFSLA